MRKLPIAVAVFFTLTVVSSALAAGYGAAGCGWGGKVIQKNDILAQLGATILNNSLSNQTFAISSGTSGCSKAFGAVMAEAEQTRFVENNYHSLAKDMAVGEGEDLNTLAGLLGCSADQTKNFASFAKQNYGSIFKGEQNTPSEILASLKEGLSNDPVLAVSCQRI